MSGDDPAIGQYANYMKAVKLRVAAIDSLGMPPLCNSLPGEIQLESIFLQFRKILELIAMASLVANQKALAAARADFKKSWHASKILREIARINPGFYPEPVVENHLPDGMRSLEPCKHDVLTEHDFCQLYDRACGTILHTANPFGHQIQYRDFTDSVHPWRAKIIGLLNQHKIRLLGDPQAFWLIQMKVDGDDEVHFTRFEVHGPA